jgi:hypothetical protein
MHLAAGAAALPVLSRFTTAQAKPYEKLQRYWTDSDTGISTAAPSEQTVDGLERTYGVKLPDEFRDYLIYSSPADGYSCVDQNMTSWWPLDRIKSIVDEYPHPVHIEGIAREAAKYLFFADYAIWCWAWAIACGDDENRGRVVCISGRDRFVADGFAQFVDRYVDDFRQLY